MIHIHRAVLLSLVTCVFSASVFPRTNSIQWTPCGNNATVPYLCGTLTVPLDYQDQSSNKTLDLALAKVSASKQPSKGSILFNPGGPGEAGRNMLGGNLATSLLIASGGYHDLIFFDSRGTGDTIPFECYEDPISKLLSQAVTPILTNSSDTAVGQDWVARAGFAEQCHQPNLDTGNLIGTAYVARDMMQIVDALGEDGLLRYWGISYGTVLGATVAAMFPDRMDKIVLDGVVNAHDYYSGVDIDSVTDADAVSMGFFSGCVAAPDLCPLARNGATALDLSNQFDEFLQHLKYNPVWVPALGPIDYKTVKLLYFRNLYTPSTWAVIASFLDALMTGNYVKAFTVINELSAGGELFEGAPLDEAEGGIRCSDSRLRANKLADIQPYIDESQRLSKMGGERWADYMVECSQWQFDAKERYDGDFHVCTKNPMLILNNKFDPVTPLISAQNMSSGFEGSVLLESNGYGHASVSQPSICTAKAVQAYFRDGILPALNTVCEPSVPTFTTMTNSTQIFSPIARRAMRYKRSDDERLLAAITDVHRSFVKAR